MISFLFQFIQKVPAGFFNVDFLKEVFKTFPIIIAQYSDSLLELLNSLQKSNVFEINEFSSTCFIELFSNELSDKKEIIGSLVQFLCEKTPQLPFGPRSDFKVMTLNILNAMRKESLLIHYKILLRVLNYQKVQLTFDEHRLVMELLCSLAFTAEFNGNLSNIEKKKLEEERDALQEHLEMTMNKLMCNPDMKIKALGIIGAVKIVSALIVNIVMDSEDVGKTTKLSIDDLPAGQIKNAAKHVQFIIDAVRGNPHGFAMICDELSLGFKDGKVTYNELFMTWLSEMMFDRLDEVAGFQMSKELPENISYQLQVICSDFDEPDVAYKLGMLDNNEAIFIPSLFKLTRLLSQQINGNLRDCYIFSVMPLALPTNFEDNSKNKRSRLNLHFNCVNWLREIIGTYCHWNQDDKEALCEIVKQRLKQLVKVEKRLAMMLQRTPENFYPPPASFLDIENKKKSFDSLRREKKPPSKKSKKNLTVPEDDDEVNLDGINKFFREIDTQVIVLMMEKFKFSVETSGSDLGIEELHFLLEDVLNKISALCNPRASPGFYDPIKVIRDINATVIPSMVGIFEAIRGEFVSMSQKAEMDDVDNVFYTKDANILKNCFRLILELFTVIFTWRKLKLQKNKEVLLETLKTLVPEGDDKDVEQLASLIIEYCVEFEGNVKSIDCALALAKFLHAISKLTDSDIHQDFVAKTVENFLKKQWKNSKGDDDEGTTFNVCLEKLLEIYVETADFNKLEGFVDQMAEDFKFIANKQLSHQRSFSSFTKTNSIVMLRVYMSRLSQIIGSSLSTSYEFWRRCSAVFGKFEEITKGLGTAVAYLLFLKNFLVFMKGFNTQGVAALKLTVKNKTNFIAMVRSVQKLARFSHGLSCDLKVI